MMAMSSSISASRTTPPNSSATSLSCSSSLPNGCSSDVLLNMSTEALCSRDKRVESLGEMVLGGFMFCTDRLFATRSWARLLWESARCGIAGLDDVAGTAGIDSMDSALRTILVEVVDVDSREALVDGK